MAKTALTQLQDQIEEVRREAFAAGYAAAMQAIRDVTSQPAPGAAPAGVRTPGRGRPRAAAPVRTARARSAAAPSGPAQRPAGRRRQAGATPRAPARAARAPGKRPQRGTNARLVAEVLQSSAPRPLRPAEIRSALQRDKGVAMAFTSIRHALGQLEGSHTAEQVADSKTWRHTGGTSA